MKNQKSRKQKAEIKLPPAYERQLPIMGELELEMANRLGVAAGWVLTPNGDGARYLLPPVRKLMSRNLDALAATYRALPQGCYYRLCRWTTGDIELLQKDWDCSEVKWALRGIPEKISNFTIQPHSTSGNQNAWRRVRLRVVDGGFDELVELPTVSLSTPCKFREWLLELNCWWAGGLKELLALHADLAHEFAALPSERTRLAVTSKGK